jgi:uncharacterized membrane protein
METERRHASGVLLVLAAAILWGSLGPVSRVALAEGMEPLAVAFWRATFGWVFFAAHAGAQRSLVIARHDIALVVLFGLVSVSGFYGSYQLAVLFGGAARAAVLLYTAPVWVAGLAIAFLGERLRRRTAAGILVSLSGVALISVSSGGETGVPAGMTGTGGGLGILFGLIAGFTYALYYILGRRLLGRVPIDDALLVDSGDRGARAFSVHLTGDSVGAGGGRSGLPRARSDVPRVPLLFRRGRPAPRVRIGGDCDGGAGGRCSSRVHFLGREARGGGLDRGCPRARWSSHPGAAPIVRVVMHMQIYVSGCYLRRGGE